MLTDSQKNLVEENHNLIMGYANLRKIDLEEWYGVLAIALCEAVTSYDESKGNLSTLFYIKADNVMANEYRKTETAKRKNEGEISYEEHSEYVGGITVDFHDVDLSWVDDDIRRMIEMKLNGYTQTEIADEFGLTQPYISKLLNRFKIEFKKRCENDG